MMLKVGKQHSLHLKKKYIVLNDSFNGEKLRYLAYELGHN